MEANLTQQTMELIKAAQAAGIEKAWTQATGLVNYDLEGPAKLLYPVLTPLRNEIPRTKSNGGTATNWRAITGINTANIGAGVEEGKRGGVLTTTVADFLAAYKGLGLEDTVTFEADYAAQGYDDPKARAITGTLQALMQAEERVIYGGWAGGSAGTTVLPVPGTPAGTASGTGTVAAAAQICSVVALTPDGYRRSSVAGGVALSASRTNADGTTTTVAGGHSNDSAGSSTVTPSGSELITWTCAASRGAAAYAWYVGVSGSQLLAAITTVNKFVQTAVAAGTQNITAITADDSIDATVFNGLWSFYGLSALNGYHRSLDGVTLTTDGAGGIAELNVVFNHFWDTWKLSPTRMIMASAQAQKISNLVTANTGGAGAFKINIDAGTNGQRGLVGGTIVSSILNPAYGGGVAIPIMVHPDAVPGTIMFDVVDLPYANNDIPRVKQIKTRQEYYQTEWPLRTRKYEYGVYVDEVLQHYAPFAGGLLQNVG